MNRSTDVIRKIRISASHKIIILNLGCGFQKNIRNGIHHSRIDWTHSLFPHSCPCAIFTKTTSNLNLNNKISNCRNKFRAGRASKPIKTLTNPLSALIWKESRSFSHMPYVFLKLSHGQLFQCRKILVKNLSPICWLF